MEEGCITVRIPLNVPKDMRPHSDNRADQSADDAEHERFGQELQADIGRSGSDSLADADLTRPFGDADQHDIHDADAADDQRHPCHPCKQ